MAPNSKFADHTPNKHRVPDEISDDDLDDMGDDPMMHAEPTFGSHANAHNRPSLNSDNKVNKILTLLSHQLTSKKTLTDQTYL